MSEEPKEIRSIVTPVRVEYNYTPGQATTRFLRGIKQGKLMGQRCPVTGKVYMPPRGSSPTHGVPTEEEVEVADKDTVTTFCVVRVPSENIDLELPYVAAHILLDGADIPFFSLLQELKTEDVRMGMRVEAVWVPEEEFDYTLQNIKYFRPIDEPDVPFEQFKEHL